MEYKFEKPYEFEGKIYEKLDVDLDRITGETVIKGMRKAAKALQRSELSPVEPAFYILTDICDLPDEFFLRMPGRDYIKLSAIIPNFLDK